MLSTGEMLERALVEDFSSLATHSAYADWLSEQGDPRGEYIALQIQLDGPRLPAPEARQLQRRADQLFDQHAPDWFGDLTPFLLPRRTDEGFDVEPHSPNYQYTFSRGWLTELDIDEPRHSFMQVLAEEPAARMLQRLVLRRPQTRTRTPHLLEPLTRCRHLQALRELHLGNSTDTFPHSVGLLESLLDRLPRLERLTLNLRNYDPESLWRRDWGPLRRMAMMGLGRVPLAELGRNASLAHLTHLDIHGAHRRRDFAPPDPVPTTRALVPLRAAPQVYPPDEWIESPGEFFDSPHLGALSNLSLFLLNDFGDTLVESLARGRLLRQLEHLSFSCGLTDAGAGALARAPLRHLITLDVSFNCLSEAGLDRLRQTGVTVVSAVQNPRDAT